VNILLALVPISLILLGLAIYAFVWAVRAGQYDDLDTPALDILVEERGGEHRDGEDQDTRGERANASIDSRHAAHCDDRIIDADGRGRDA
jgi:cbb3-type cytochrome oxidase maturation protein